MKINEVIFLIIVALAFLAGGAVGWGLKPAEVEVREVVREVVHEVKVVKEVRVEVTLNGQPIPELSRVVPVETR